MKINWLKILKERLMFYPDRIETDSKEILTDDLIMNEAVRQLRIKNTMTTIGEQRVRTTFNPSNDSIVDVIKQKSAWLINLCEELKNKDARLASLAQTAYEEAAMWAVKAATTETPTD